MCSPPHCPHSNSAPALLDWGGHRQHRMKWVCAAVVLAMSSKDPSAEGLVLRLRCYVRGNIIRKMGSLRMWSWRDMGTLPPIHPPTHTHFIASQPSWGKQLPQHASPAVTPAPTSDPKSTEQLIMHQNLWICNLKQTFAPDKYFCFNLWHLATLTSIAWLFSKKTLFTKEAAARGHSLKLLALNDLLVDRYACRTSKYKIWPL